MSVKPVILIKFPLSVTDEHLEYMSEKLTKKFYDYHVLLFPAMVDEIDFQFFYEKDFTQTEFGNIQDYIRENIKNIKKQYEETNENEDVR